MKHRPSNTQRVPLSGTLGDYTYGFIITNAKLEMSEGLVAAGSFQPAISRCFATRQNKKLRSAAVNQQPANPDNRFPGFVRIRLRDDFARIYAVRRYASDKRMTIYVLENELPFTRIGMSVGRKVGGAVQRNLIKRRIRAAFRSHKADLPVGYDLLCVVRAGPPASLAEYTDSLCRLTKRAIARNSK